MPAKVACIGDLNEDRIVCVDAILPSGQEGIASAEYRTIGGSTAIVACALARLNRAVDLYSLVGSDARGNFLIESLGKHHVNTDYIQHDPSVPTGITYILAPPTGERTTYTFPGTVSTFSDRHLDFTNLHRYALLHVGALFYQQSFNFLPLFRYARRHHITVSLDPGGDPSRTWARLSSDLLENVDLLFLNWEEAQALARAQTEFTLHPQAGMRHALHALSQKVKQLVIIKSGKAGAIAENTETGEVWETEAYQVASIDSIGAGDNFAAGFLTAYLDNVPPWIALEIAGICGALSTRGIGGTSTQADFTQIATILHDQAGESSRRIAALTYVKGKL